LAQARPTGLSTISLFVWLVADGWCWFVLREKYGWLVAGGLSVLREKYCWLVADKPSEQGAYSPHESWKRLHQNFNKDQKPFVDGLIIYFCGIFGKS
jgi:hypothetical protein